MLTTTIKTLMADKTILLGRAAERQWTDLMATTTTSAPLAAAPTNQLLYSDNMDVAILSQQQVAVSSSSLYSIDELSHWASANCTALIHALLASFSVILVSELGDKTFIITAIMAMKNSRLLVFLSSAFALFTMTVLSVVMGVAVTVVPKLYTHYASIVLFLCFGLKMLKEAYDMEYEGEQSEFDEVKRSLEDESDQEEEEKVKKDSPMTAGKMGASESLTPALDATWATADDGPIGGATSPTKDDEKLGYFSQLTKTLYIAPIVIKVFTMIFVAEWGDRSQISTVILAAREDVVGVFVGSLTGHVLCTGLAVIGGRFVADMISVRTSKCPSGVADLRHPRPRIPTLQLT